MIKKIAFDIDGVLQDYQEYVVNTFLNQHHHITCEKYNGRIDYTQYDSRRMFPDCRNTDIVNMSVDHIFADYVRHAPFEPHVRDLFRYLKSKKIEIHIVTARQGNEGISSDEMEQITKDRFFEEDIPVDEFHIGFNDKLTVIRGAGIECIVEDKPENIIQLSEEIPVFVLTRPYNRLVMGSNMYHIETLYPEEFYKKLQYMCDHRNYLGSTAKYQDNPALDVTLIDGRAYVNMGRASTKDPIFIVPLSGKNETSLLECWKAYCRGNATVIDLYEIDKPLEEIKNPIIRETAWYRSTDENTIMATNEMSSETYQLRSKVIRDILEIVRGRNNRYIIFGPQIMQLERKYLQELKDSMFIFPHVTDAAKKIFIDSVYKKDYDIALLIEDLDEVSMDTRKFKIIAGTDKPHLVGYVNRQYFSANGIDTVSFVSGERPYNPENLDAALTLDTYLIGDCHLTEKDKEKTQMIVDNINRTVGNKDVLLFLGDFDGKFGASKEAISNFVKKLNCKNLYMLVGNNDGYKLSDYIRMGFKGINDVVKLHDSSNSNIVISHCPLLVENGDINIHGHLHGGRVYWNIPAENHLDIYNEDFTPIKVRDCLEIISRGYYQAKTINVGF